MKAKRKAIKFIRYEERFVNYEWNHYKTVLIILMILLTLESYLTGSLQKFFNSIGEYGYVGSFAAGFLYSYGVTTPFAVAAFLVLSKNLNIWILTLLGTLGGLLGEYFIYDFAKKEAGKSLRFYRGRELKMPKVKSKLLKRLSPLIAGIVIATPIPDEFLAFLFGIEDYKLRDFLILTFFSKLIGTFLIVGLGRVF